LLALLAARSAAADAVPVGEEDLPRLQAANPKGQLLEWCAQNKQPEPQFEQAGDPEGYRVRAVLSPDGAEPIRSGWHLAATLKAAEQAAAEAVLACLPSVPASVPQEIAPATPASEAGGRNAAMLLNELKQSGILRTTGYDVVQQDGPSHQPVFAVVAWATTEDGRAWRTAPVSAQSKKSGQRSAAERLLDELVEHGITRR
jgi:dsRNA-specific ribonuclease